jgi:hypothetical protein
VIYENAVELRFLAGLLSCWIAVNSLSKELCIYIVTYTFKVERMENIS